MMPQRYIAICLILIAANVSAQPSMPGYPYYPVAQMRAPVQSAPEPSNLAAEQLALEAAARAESAQLEAQAQVEEIKSAARVRVQQVEAAAQFEIERAKSHYQQLRAELTASARFDQLIDATVAETSDELLNDIFRRVADMTKERLKQGAEAVRLGNYAMAYHLWLPLAQTGNAEAQYAMGWLYHNGYGLRIDDIQAQQWWQRAAEQGHAESLYSLATLHSTPGAEVEQNPRLALDYYFRAASLGHDEARTMLLNRMVSGDEAIREHSLSLYRELGLWSGHERLVEVPRANLRRGPGTHNPIITTLSAPQKVVELARNDRWLLVAIVGQDTLGWLYDSLVGPAGEEVTAQLVAP